MVEELEQVILVDEKDNELGLMEKLQAHEEGRLHRAVSVFVFNSKNQLLLQKRSDNKYHSPGLWTNTCCSHPRKGESTLHAATRRLEEEMGMTCDLKQQFSFIYKAYLDNNLIEHELDYVYTGLSDVAPVINPTEASAWKYEGLKQIEENIKNNPGEYTEWFKLIFNRVVLQQQQ